MKFIMHITWSIYQATSFMSIQSHEIHIMADFITWLQLFSLILEVGQMRFHKFSLILEVGQMTQVMCFTDSQGPFF